MAEPAWLIARREWEAWTKTPVGAAFARFEYALIAYWSQDSNERISDKRLNELDEISKQTRADLIVEIKKLMADKLSAG